ncbi:adenine phosphoribosyltransferase [Methylophilus rhizosphaerae]|uniref:Adenine phosphoribosyltransferase n=1 Tax=Methylophilus rhizosphaerae TaxID=492660 RepID=A0A1G9CJ15_9PROT|nr:adenine phosphoribosyltransferase [Methylophilus rhizosphaerae]SDK51629.1 adenine phosphoribosyltransferase [Methylophilus rhizosphaerae]
MIEALIRTIPDYPKPGVQFRDITTLLQDRQGFAAAIDALSLHYTSHAFDKVLAIESRGFIVGAALAIQLGAGFVPARKPGKLPAATISQSYTLEYGMDALELHKDAIQPGERVLLVDDLIATGGTAMAAVALVRQLGGLLAHATFIVDLPDLGGMQRLQSAGIRGFALCQFEGH